MRSRRDLRLRLEHILKGIARIERLTAGNTVEDYLADEGLREMIERNIARTSEAARHVPAGIKAKYPVIPWRQVVGVGNVIGHDYDEIDDLVMWSTATEELLPLKQAIEAMLGDLEVG
jgi:uncharacterized protein with HEPN domain